MTGGDVTTWVDFSDAAPQSSGGALVDVEEIRARLLADLRSVLFHLLPNGKVRNGTFFVGDVRGRRGKSLRVELKGSKAGMWHDFATGEGGDIIALWAAVRDYDPRRDFPRLMDEIVQWLGLNGAVRSRPPTAHNQPPPEDDLGPVTAKWDYHDRDGGLIACVYRYDPPGGKQFRPWDVRARKMRAPTPRPLYDIPGILKADRVVLVEGEKAAQALIDIGIPATTAMNGASAPVDKTDWSPLAGKQVLIWPDNDEPGKAYAAKAARAVGEVGAASVAILEPPEGKPEKWDAADAVAEGMDVAAFLEKASREHVRRMPVTVHSLGELLGDTTPMPEDLIAPRILTPGGTLVLGGAPKVGKSDFLLSFMMHMAAGAPFLGFAPPRPLRIFLLQAEIQYHYLRERVQGVKLAASLLKVARDNLFITGHLKLVLDEAGVSMVAGLVRTRMPELPDVIVVDPIRNLFDGGPGGAGENDNDAMMFFLRQRVEALREAVNPDCGVILAHHTRKLSKQQLSEDPFLALSGASSLRGYYTSGIILFRPDEEKSHRKLIFELRNGPALPSMIVDKKGGGWEEIDVSAERLVRKDYGEKLDSERNRKRDVIIAILFEEALKGHLYTSTQFREAFENKAGLGSQYTIRDRINVLTTKGYIKFLRDGRPFGHPLTHSRFGYLCVEGMRFGREPQIDPDTGEVLAEGLPVLPSHYKCPRTGACLEVENPSVWVYPEVEK